MCNYDHIIGYKQRVMKDGSRTAPGAGLRSWGIQTAMGKQDIEKGEHKKKHEP